MLFSWQKVESHAIPVSFDSFQSICIVIHVASRFHWSFLCIESFSELRFCYLPCCFALIGASLGIESGAYTFPFHILCTIQYVQYRLDPFPVCLISFSLAFISAVTTIRWARKMISFLRWAFQMSIIATCRLQTMILGLLFGVYWYSRGAILLYICYIVLVQSRQGRQETFDL